MFPELWLGLAMLFALTAYAVFGGADFGGGVWDLLARGPRAAAQRQAIAQAMGPVWEANHVWLIFFVVLMFSGFPYAFAAISVAFFWPLHLVLFGIVLRGAAFVFRSQGRLGGRFDQAWATAFGAASIITPFLLGTALAALSSGAIRVGEHGVTVATRAWLSPFSLLTGALALAISAYLAAVFLAHETGGNLQRDFQRKAWWTGTAVALLAIALVPVLIRTAPQLWNNFWHIQAELLIIAGIVFAAISWAAVSWGYFALARVTAIAEVAVLLWGWAAAQWPYLIYPDLTIWNSGANPDTLRAMLASLPIGLGLIIPSLWLLFRIFKGTNPPPTSSTEGSDKQREQLLQEGQD